MSGLCPGTGDRGLLGERTLDTDHDGPLRDGLPSAAWVAALAGLPAMGPARLSAVLACWSPPEAWQRISRGGVHREVGLTEGSRGVPAEVGAEWARMAQATDVAELWCRHADAGVEVLVAGDPGWPAVLAEDPEPPAVLFVRGSVAALVQPAVAIVGTRRCTPTGRAVARELGRDLARAGVCVVSGLALGIDGAAHLGALEAPSGAPPVAVVATGVDVSYPRAHAALTDRVAAAGAVVSEYPLGTPPAAWRFPARNRIVAGLSAALVVVESGVRGGSLYTVDAAIDRTRPVLAVPGSVRNPVAAGTNELLAAGCAPARDAMDVLVALDLGGAGGSGAGGSGAGTEQCDPAVTTDQLLVLDAVGWDASTLDQVADRLDAPLGPVALHLAGLEHLGMVTRTGAWYTRLTSGHR